MGGGGGGGSLAWAFFSGVLLLEVDSITSKRLVLGFHCIPMLFRTGEASCTWLSLTRDSGWLSTSKSSSESKTSNISPSSFSFSSSSSLLIECGGIGSRKNLMKSESRMPKCQECVLGS